jgi:hypothetical protein
MNQREELEELRAFLEERNDDDRYFGEVFSKFMEQLNRERARGISTDANPYLASLEQTKAQDLTEYQRGRQLVQYLRFVEHFENDVAEAIEDLDAGA